jgi:glyoxylase-like metal-dependent hydrolase (beta-lactamase superfamily II)
MQRERVSDNVYWFQSDTYAQVTAGAVVGPQWALLIDTLMPQDTPLVKDYIEHTLSVPVKYIINTHHHADHSWGNCFFPNATVIGHKICRDIMTTTSNSALEVAAKENAQFKSLSIIAPHITFEEGSLTIKVGKKQVRLFPTPGHSDDGISILLEEDRVLFAGDAFMPLPFFVGGDPDELAESIRLISKMSLENIIQGHGDIILRGEIEEAARSNLNYLKNVRKIVKASMRRRNTLEVLREVDIESCGKNRVTLGGCATELHQHNLRYLYDRTLSGKII